MPWKNVSLMDEIIRFVMLAQSARFTVSELCEQFGISRKTGYKHLDRYGAEGLKGLALRSHRPLRFARRTDVAVEALILAERRLHQTWGPKKLHKVLEVKHDPFQGQAMTAGSLQHELGRLGPACAPIDVPVAPMPLVKQVAPVEPLHGWLRFTRRHNALGP
jgi:hypothetical protein